MHFPNLVLSLGVCRSDVFCFRSHETHQSDFKNHARRGNNRKMNPRAHLCSTFAPTTQALVPGNDEAASSAVLHEILTHVTPRFARIELRNGINTMPQDVELFEDVEEPPAFFVERPRCQRYRLQILVSRLQELRCNSGRASEELAVLIDHVLKLHRCSQNEFYLLA